MEKALNDEDDPLASLDVEEDVMENLKDDFKMIKEKSHEKYDMTAEKLVNTDFEISVTRHYLMRASFQKFLEMLILTMKKNLMITKQPTDCISKPDFKDVINIVTGLPEYNLFSNFAFDLMKALKDVYRGFDLDWLSNEKQSTIKYFFQTL